MHNKRTAPLRRTVYLLSRLTRTALFSRSSSLTLHRSSHARIGFYDVNMNVSSFSRAVSTHKHINRMYTNWMCSDFDLTAGTRLTDGHGFILQPAATTSIELHRNGVDSQILRLISNRCNASPEHPHCFARVRMCACHACREKEKYTTRKNMLFHLIVRQN